MRQKIPNEEFKKLPIWERWKMIAPRTIMIWAGVIFGGTVIINAAELTKKGRPEKVGSADAAITAVQEKKGIVQKVKETFTGEMCGEKKVEIEKDADLVPDHPKLTALLMTNPCFNFGWFEEGGKVAVINYIPARHAVSGGQWSFPGASKDLDESLKYARFAMDMNEIGGLLDAFTLDMVRKASGPEMVEEIKKLTAKMEEETKKAKPEKRELDQAIKDTIFWDTIQKVAYQEGIRVRVSDATREREAAGKLPGDFKVPGGTAEQYEKILARMSPDYWTRYVIEGDFSQQAYEDGDIEKAITIRRQAISHLSDPRDIQAAIENTKKYLPKIADQIIVSSHPGLVQRTSSFAGGFSR